MNPLRLAPIHSCLCRAALLTVGSLWAGGTAFPSPPVALHTSGNRLCDSGRNSVVLKGVNIPSLEWRNGGDHVLQSVSMAIRRWHATIIRLPISQDRWEGEMPDDPSGPDRSDGGASYRRLVDRVVNEAAAAGVYVVVDLHWSDMGVWGRNVAQHDMPDANSATAWASVARRYANNPAVLFDAYNEPNDVSWAVWRNGGRVTEKGGSYDSPGMQGIVDVIRRTGALNVIVVGGLEFSFDLRGVGEGFGISGPNIVYACHIYPSKSPDWDRYVSAAARIAPVLIGEFGADGFSADATSFTPRVIAWIKEHHFSAIAWCMHTSARPCLISNWKYEPTFGFGTYVFSWLTGGPLQPSRLACDGARGPISLAWIGVPGAISYTVYRSPIPRSQTGSTPLASGLRDARYTDAAVKAGATYYYQVTASSSAGSSGPSNEEGATAGARGGFDAPMPTFSFRAGPASVRAVPHVPLMFSVTAVETGKTSGRMILISMQVHDGKNALVHQEIVERQSFEPGQSRAYAFAWTPDGPGTYTVQVGAFGEDFSPRFGWEKRAAVVVVEGEAR